MAFSAPVADAAGAVHEIRNNVVRIQWNWYGESGGCVHAANNNDVSFGWLVGLWFWVQEHLISKGMQVRSMRMREALSLCHGGIAWHDE